MAKWKLGVLLVGLSLVLPLTASASEEATPKASHDQGIRSVSVLAAPPAGAPQHTPIQFNHSTGACGGHCNPANPGRVYGNVAVRRGDCPRNQEVRYNRDGDCLCFPNPNRCGS